ncbi:Fibroblast growth factor receptor 1 [Bulinus truncatus]|nr:Fibroblast growth factor receptor 1 [Bulinus truncatus]
MSKFVLMLDEMFDVRTMVLMLDVRTMVLMLDEMLDVRTMVLMLDEMLDVRTMLLMLDEMLDVKDVRTMLLMLDEMLDVKSMLLMLDEMLDVRTMLLMLDETLDVRTMLLMLDEMLDEYLSEKKYVHRDLAARNVLIHYNKVVKVCDFGLSRDIFNDNHYKKLTNGKLPLKWMAIESLRDRIFTTQSDVWSFGILLWEIVTMGASPYPNVALADLYFVLSTGYRMDKPSNCSDELYAIMRSCWEDESTDRPTFTQLRFMLEELLTEDRDYLVLEDIDVPITNSDNSSTPSPQSLSADRTGEAEGGAVAGMRPYPVMMMPGDPSQASPTTPSQPIKIAKKAAPRRDHMRINVCIHQKSTDRLIRPSESDSSPSSC